MCREVKKLKTIQPFFYMNSPVYEQEWYLNQGISHFYAFQTGESPVVCAVPDGCMDMIFVYKDGKMNAYACGTVLDYREYELTSNADIFCVRFLPGEMPAILEGMPAQFLEKMVPVDLICRSRTLLSNMSREYDFYRRVRVFLREYSGFYNRREGAVGKEKLVEACRDTMVNTDGKVKIADLAEETGYSTRYINKVFFEAYGFSPKVFCKVVQFQRTLEFLNSGSQEKMTEAAVQLGYYDQPQFIRDFKAHCGMTPKKYTMLVKNRQFVQKMKDFYEEEHFSFQLPIAN